MILEDAVELANTTLRVDGPNKKSALGLLSKGRSTGFSSLPRLI